MASPSNGSGPPAEWLNHWSAMPNSVDALYCTFGLRVWRGGWLWRRPIYLKREIRMEAWGQLCFDDAAARVAANYMHNHPWTRGWEYLSWRVEMSGPLVGGAKLRGVAPADFEREWRP